MRFIDLDEDQIEFLNAYMALPQEDKRLAEYITRIGASRILSSEEYKDFLDLLKKTEDKSTR
jgi:isocitrate dehydrogenase kinase/phosphatase